MDKELTIIKNLQSLNNYAFVAIPTDVLDLMQRCYLPSVGEKTTYLLKVFDAYCHITGTSITYLSLSSPSFLDTVKGFLGALASETYLALLSPGRQRYAKAFMNMLDEMRRDIPLLPKLTKEERVPQNHIAAWKKIILSVNQNAVRYWNGWAVNGRRKGNFSYIPINLIWNSHGEEFAENIYKAYRQHDAKFLVRSHSTFNLFLVYLSQNSERWPALSFQHPIEIKTFFCDFMLFYFQDALANGTDLRHKAKLYNSFIHNIEEIFIQPSIWTKPFTGSLPRPIAKAVPGHQTNLKKMADGTIIKDKLITAIPLHLTDSEAIEIIFKKISNDNKLVLRWAKRRLLQSRKAQLRRDNLALTGTLINEKERLSSMDEIGENNFCATFKSRGLAYIRKNAKTIFSKLSSHTLANPLALPKKEDSFALQLLLTYYHPCLTESFFSDLELYDKRGTLSGFMKTDNGYQLIGYKDRKGNKLSEQKIDLTTRTTAWISQYIHLTKPLRDELRIAGDDSWRYLFLHCPRCIDYPTRPRPFRLNPSIIDWYKTIIEDFSKICDLGRNDIQKFLMRVSVTAMRASSGVEIYIRTHSVKDMATALGHTNYNASLLASYLPEPILSFFQSRWIRIFQRGIICEAMKNSPRLLEATKFETMSELHEFLKNHALRDIPEYLKNPEILEHSRSDKASTKNNQRILISIDAGVLTALISLNEAVKNAKHQSKICSTAIYWSRFTNLVVREIEEGYNSDLQAYLSIAQHHANPKNMESLINETSS
ncbi:hypothetical protein [Pseudomonas sp. C2B4]|uniref:hypothetical protein n=1 Tax=Pseudomonas sp. C2B4 TaxID=2735270 RepID=UPI001586CB44|nr:hypothetical protein [Pseudomonas sp. C2B4]NUU34327.1 hypothetical protein [Pseudomonas sp. C2B4]